MRFLRLLFLVMTVATACAQPITVMSYNIRYDTASDGVNQWTNRKDRVAALIRRNQPDLVGLQEALRHQIDDILARLPDYDVYGVGRDDGKTKGEYSAILVRRSRFEVRASDTFWLSDTPTAVGVKGWDAALPRIATWTRLYDREAKRELLMLNTHFDHRGVQARIQSAAALKAHLMSVHAATPVPIIMTGDLNVEPTSEAFTTLIAGGFLRDARPAGYTQPTSLGFEASSPRMSIIDYVLHNDGFVPKAFAVITDNDGRYFPSDHLPVLARLEFTSAR
ncbi:MAG TPA: endonuclease/exonuclease/phosphatase family protein [Opitutaceae bacterium]